MMYETINYKKIRGRGTGKFKTYMRRCRRCEELYRTHSKFSTICPDCAKPCSGGWNHAKSKR